MLGVLDINLNPLKYFSKSKISLLPLLSPFKWISNFQHTKLDLVISTTPKGNNMYVDGVILSQ